MQKSLFKKFIGTYFAVALFAIFLLGTVTLAFTGNYSINEKQTVLRAEALSVSNRISASGGMTRDTYQTVISVLSNSSHGDMFITDTTGKMLVASGRYVNRDSVIPDDYAKKAIQGETTRSTTLEGLLPTKCLVVSVPVVLSSGKTIAVVYNVLAMSEVSLFVKSVFKLFAISSIIVLVFLTFAAYWMTARLVRPVKEMAIAATSISKGDFSHRITVDRDDEIGELAIAFNHMSKSLSASEHMNRSFIANVSHELKTPMTTISGFIDGILDGTIPKESHEKYLYIVSTEIKRLSRIVVSMLNLSKIESGEIALNPEEVDLKENLISIAFGFERQISEKNIEMLGLDKLEECKAFADQELIYQVLYNLCDNAIKYTPQNGSVEFHSGEQDGKAVFSIKNSGEGIPEKDLPYVFDRFYKVDKSRGTDRKGTGLGLYLVKTIISLHKGSITVKSTEGEYCEFIVTLPGVPEENTISQGDAKNDRK